MNKNKGMSELMELAINFAELYNKNRKSETSMYKLGRKFIKEMDLTDEELQEFIDIYPEWGGVENGVTIEKGELLKYNDVLYRCILEHTKEETFNPEDTNYAFVKVVPDEVIGEWVGGGYENAYSKGDKVTFEGKIYESKIDRNSWSPSAAPQHWTEIEE